MSDHKRARYASKAESLCKVKTVYTKRHNSDDDFLKWYSGSRCHDQMRYLAPHDAPHDAALDNTPLQDEAPSGKERTITMMYDASFTHVKKLGKFHIPTTGLVGKSELSKVMAILFPNSCTTILLQDEAPSGKERTVGKSELSKVMAILFPNSCTAILFPNSCTALVKYNSCTALVKYRLG